MTCFLNDEVIPLNAVCLNDGRVLSNSEEWHRAASEFVGVSECGEKDV